MIITTKAAEAMLNQHGEDCREVETYHSATAEVRLTTEEREEYERDSETILDSDEPAASVFDALRAWVEKNELGAEYERLIGYNPFVDDPSLTIKTVAKTLAEWKAERAKRPTAYAVDGL